MQGLQYAIESFMNTAKLHKLRPQSEWKEIHVVIDDKIDS